MSDELPDLDPAAVDQVARQLKRKSAFDASMKAFVEIHGADPESWALTLENMTALLLSGKLISGPGLGFNPEAYIEQLRRRIAQLSGQEQSRIVVSTQMPPAPKLKNGRN